MPVAGSSCFICCQKSKAKTIPSRSNPWAFSLITKDQNSCIIIPDYWRRQGTDIDSRTRTHNGNECTQKQYIQQIKRVARGRAAHLLSREYIISFIYLYNVYVFCSIIKPISQHFGSKKVPQSSTPTIWHCSSLDRPLYSLGHSISLTIIIRLPCFTMGLF